MTVLVVGASGATGRLLVEQLLQRGVAVKIIVRPERMLPASLTDREQITLIRATLLDLSDAELAEHVKGCDAVASCLGHTMSVKGLYAHPRKLVTDATRRLCYALKATRSDKPARFVLMNTAGNRNRDRNEPISAAEQCVVSLVRLLLPPHSDNEQAADTLRVEIGQNDPDIEWVVVRPDTLINADVVTAYNEYPSPIRSAIFNPGTTSRINVAHFMARLMTEEDTWNIWRGQMPVVYNEEPAA
jgi:nucleoside-diphosphate-sugar epimerase